MWTIPSAGRWIFLLSLMLVLIFSVSEVKSSTLLHRPCCTKVDDIKVSEDAFWEQFEACYEQNPRPSCNRHAFVLQTREGRFGCFNPEHDLLSNMKKEGKLECKPI